MTVSISLALNVIDNAIDMPCLVSIIDSICEGRLYMPERVGCMGRRCAEAECGGVHFARDRHCYCKDQSGHRKDIDIVPLGNLV